MNNINIDHIHLEVGLLIFFIAIYYGMVQGRYLLKDFSMIKKDWFYSLLGYGIAIAGWILYQNFYSTSFILLVVILVSAGTGISSMRYFSKTVKHATSKQSLQAIGTIDTTLWAVMMGGLYLFSFINLWELFVPIAIRQLFVLYGSLKEKNRF